MDIFWVSKLLKVKSDKKQLINSVFAHSANFITESYKYCISVDKQEILA